MNEELLQMIKLAVGQSVDEKINGKLRDIKQHLDNQDDTLVEVKQLLEERKFLMQLWAFIKFLGGVAVSAGGAILLYKNIK